MSRNRSRTASGRESNSESKTSESGVARRRMRALAEATRQAKVTGESIGLRGSARSSQEEVISRAILASVARELERAAEMVKMLAERGVSPEKIAEFLEAEANARRAAIEELRG